MLGMVAVALALAVTACTKHAENLDPAAMLPNSYKQEFENDWVRIMRVHYDAKAKLPEHTHAAGATVYLYFNASPGVLYSHAGGIPNTRPPVKPGGIRIGSAPLEHHTVENLGDTPTDFIRILLKTEYVDKRVPNSRMQPAQMDYDHLQLRITRINVEPGTKTHIEAREFPLLRVAWVPGETEWKLAANPYRFLEKGASEDFEAAGTEPMQLVTIEMKSAKLPPAR